jgi:hypothetical protein
MNFDQWSCSVHTYKRLVATILGAIALASLVAPGHATTRSVTGTISNVIVEPGTIGAVTTETVTFMISSPPAATGCTANNGIFAFSSQSIADAPTRNHMVAWLLSAKASGAQVTVVYDDAGRLCDPLGYAAPIAISLP